MPGMLLEHRHLDFKHVTASLRFDNPNFIAYVRLLSPNAELTNRTPPQMHVVAVI